MKVTIFRTYSTIIEIEDHVIEMAKASGDATPVIDAHLAAFPELLPEDPGCEIVQDREFYDEEGDIL